MVLASWQTRASGAVVSGAGASGSAAAVGATSTVVPAVAEASMRVVAVRDRRPGMRKVNVMR